MIERALLILIHLVCVAVCYNACFNIYIGGQFCFLFLLFKIIDNINFFL